MILTHGFHDLRALRLVASREERDLMIAAAALITDRGYNGGRDLSAAVQTLLMDR